MLGVKCKDKKGEVEMSKLSMKAGNTHSRGQKLVREESSRKQT